MFSIEFLPKLIHSHAGFAYISLILLLSRGFLAYKGVDWRQYKVLKIAPHAVDTLLLLSGACVLYSVLSNEIYPLGEMGWLFAKFVFIVGYVIFAIKTFKRGNAFSLYPFCLTLGSFLICMGLAMFHELLG